MALWKGSIFHSFPCFMHFQIQGFFNCPFSPSQLLTPAVSSAKNHDFNFQCHIFWDILVSETRSWACFLHVQVSQNVIIFLPLYAENSKTFYNTSSKASIVFWSNYKMVRDSQKPSICCRPSNTRYFHWFWWMSFIKHCKLFICNCTIY